MPTETKSPAPRVLPKNSYIDRRREMRWIDDHGDDYPGEWVALDEDRLLAHGMDAKQVFAEARSKHPKPLFAHLEPNDPRPQCDGW